MNDHLDAALHEGLDGEPTLNDSQHRGHILAGTLGRRLDRTSDLEERLLDREHVVWTVEDRRSGVRGKELELLICDLTTDLHEEPLKIVPLEGWRRSRHRDDANDEMSELRLLAVQILGLRPRRREKRRLADGSGSDRGCVRAGAPYRYFGRGLPGPNGASGCSSSIALEVIEEQMPERVLISEGIPLAALAADQRSADRWFSSGLAMRPLRRS